MFSRDLIYKVSKLDANEEPKTENIWEESSSAAASSFEGCFDFSLFNLQSACTSCDMMTCVSIFCTKIIQISKMPCRGVLQK